MSCRAGPDFHARPGAWSYCLSSPPVLRRSQGRTTTWLPDGWACVIRGCLALRRRARAGRASSTLRMRGKEQTEARTTAGENWVETGLVLRRVSAHRSSPGTSTAGSRAAGLRQDFARSRFTMSGAPVVR